MSALYMFPPTEEPAEDHDLLAGEYVLGVLDPGEAAAVRLRAETDPILRSAIALWQERLIGMTAMLPRHGVPEGLWLRLAEEIGVRASPPMAAMPAAAPVLPALPDPPLAPVVLDDVPPAGPEERDPAALHRPEPQVQTIPPDPSPTVGLFESLTAPAMPPPAAPTLSAPPVQAPPLRAPPRSSRAALGPLLRRIGVWQIATAASLGLAVALGVLLLLPRGELSRQIAAIGPVSAPAPLFLAECDAAGRLSVTPLATIAVPGGRDLELWTLPPGAGSNQRPTSLGVLPANGRVVSLGGAVPEGTQLLVSMEPRGGSPSGQITGPVLYGGVLANH